MKIAYFDCFSGISGDMILGALIDAGLSPERLRRGLSGLALKGFSLKVRSVQKHGLRATKVDVIPGPRPAGLSTLADLEKTLLRSRLPDPTRRKARGILKRLIGAEAKAHGKPPGRVKLHGMEPTDTLVDIVGAVLGLDLLGIEQVVASPLHVGGGIKGMAPATAHLLEAIPIYSSGIQQELVTPTGAAILSHLASDFGPLAPMTVRAVGYGAGSMDLEWGPNLLRLLTGESLSPGHGYETDRVIQIETQIDDLSPQIYEHLIERLLAAGALDVYLIPVIMKKGRPGTLVGLLASPETASSLMALLFDETTTIGLRIQEVSRAKLIRREKQISTPLGPVRVKLIHRHGAVEAVPEYEDCRAIARRLGRPLRSVLEEVRKAARAVQKKSPSGGTAAD